MKKFLAVILAVLMVIGTSTVAFAAGSPIKTVTTEDLPQELPATIVAPAPAAEAESVEDLPEELPEEVSAETAPKSKSGEDLPEGSTSLVSVADMTDEQKAEVNAVIAEIAEEGLVPVAAFAFEVSEDAAEEFESQTIVISLTGDEVIIINGKKYTAKDLESLGDGMFALVLTEPCVVVIARSK